MYFLLKNFFEKIYFILFSNSASNFLILILIQRKYFNLFINHSNTKGEDQHTVFVEAESRVLKSRSNGYKLGQ